MMNTLKNVVLQINPQRGLEYALVLTIKAVALAGVVGVAVTHLAARNVGRVIDNCQKKFGLR